MVGLLTHKAGDTKAARFSLKEKGTDLFKLELKGILNKSVPFRSVPFVHSKIGHIGGEAMGGGK